jgi:hypothetical protein
MDASKLLRLINEGNLAYGEEESAKQMYYQIFVARNKEQAKLAYYSYQGYLDNLSANASSIIINPILLNEMEILYNNLNSIIPENQKE